MPSINPKELFRKSATTAHKYALVGFLVFLVSVYGFLSWRILYFSQLEPDQSEVTNQLKTAGVPKINEDAIRKIEQLKDNSVSVQTLFEQARDNPFQE
ncbi:MAG TPA: hypothetical protein VK983_00465 [Candidatus Limnocylindrales bacterium]|nr:hypothetical protein [Candidatus Limnocylindrales bacterium]